MSPSNLFKTALAFAAGLAVVAFVWFALARPFIVAADGGPPVMRSYPVVGDHAEEVRSALQASLNTGDGKRLLGRVTLAPNGQLIVTAPESIQRGVQSMLDDVLSIAPGPTPTIRLEVWFVRSEAGAAEPDARLRELAPALDAIRQAQGAQGFALVEKLTLHSRAGQHGRIAGVRATLDATVSLRRAQAEARAVSSELRLEVRSGPNLQAQLELTPGELLVLGESAYVETRTSEAPVQTLYYVVRATL